MALTILRRPLPQVPPLGAALDQSAALASGLLAPCYLMHEGGGSRLGDLVGQVPAALTAGTWSVGPTGPAVLFNGTTTKASMTAWALGSIGSVALWIYPNFSTATVTGSAVACYVFDTDVGVATNRTLFYYDGSGSIGAWGWYIGGTAIFDGSAAPIANSMPGFAWHHVALTWNLGLAAAKQLIYVDGKLLNTYNITATQTKPVTLFLGQSHSAGSFWNGRMAGLAAWNRVLAAGEVAQLHNDPYALALPPGRTRWAAAGGGVEMGPATHHLVTPLTNPIYRM